MVYPSISTPYFDKKTINNIITIIIKAGSHNLVLLNKFNTLVTVFDFLLMPFLNLPEKLILSFKFLILDIDITSCKSQKVIKDIMLW